MNKCVVVFSGGQDSTTVLAHARYLGLDCHAIAFDYGQKHKVELRQAQKIADALNVPLKIVNLRAFGELVGSKSALLNNGQEVTEVSPLNADLPASFVPNRNAVMLTLAHGFAQVIGAHLIYTGVCQTDYSGYPDCRREFIDSLEKTLNLGYKTNIAIVTPLMHLTKAETFKMADECHALDLVIEESHTCYNGVRYGAKELFDSGAAIEYVDARHEWGHGCGECPACLLRKRGYEEFCDMVRIG